MAEGRGRWLLCGMLILWIWSGLMMLVRAWAKISTNRWGSDDYMITAAFFASAMDLAASFWAVQQEYGLPSSSAAENVQSHIAKALFAQQQFYIAAMTLCKISVTLFLVRLSTSKTHTRPCFTVVGLTVAWGAVAMLVVGLRGELDSPWDTMDGSFDMYLRWIIIEAFGIIIELLNFIIAVALVRRIHISWCKRTAILAAFAVRLALIPIITARLYYLAPERNRSSTFTNIVPHIITETALHFAVISASITSLRPFLRTFRLDYAISSKGNFEYGTGCTKHSEVRSQTHARQRSSVSFESLGKHLSGKHTSSCTDTGRSSDRWEVHDIESHPPILELNLPESQDWLCTVIAPNPVIPRERL